MLDTSDIPSDELEQAMLDESIKAWNSELNSIYENYKTSFKFIMDYKVSIDNDISNKKYKEALTKLHMFNRSLRDLEEYAIYLSNFLYVMPTYLSQ